MSNLIYAYTVIGKDAEPWERSVGLSRVKGRGLIKVGQTTKAKARTRIKQQLGTVFPDLKGVEILHEEPAVAKDGGEFSDHEVHEALVKAGVRRPGGEWFEGHPERRSRCDQQSQARGPVRPGEDPDVSDAPGAGAGG